jgi:hypothetical protein
MGIEFGGQASKVSLRIWDIETVNKYPPAP